MFRSWSCCGKKSKVVAVTADEISSQRSVTVPDDPTAVNNKDERVPWRYRLFGRPLTKDNHPQKEKQSVTHPDGKTPKEHAKKPKTKKPRWWCCRKKRCQVAPSPEEQSQKNNNEEEEEEVAVSTSRILRYQQVGCLGFPNPAQICYMNSCLQSLLTLENFVRDISRQEDVWGLSPESALMKSFMDIRRSQFSSDATHKICLLAAFKKAVSQCAPEFQDLHQKDAHEFLTSVLQQMACLSSQLQVLATSMGRAYSCPVEDSFMFKMATARICKSCGKESTREETFTDLSLDLAPGGGTVEQMLQDYLMETEVEYNCECSATTSGLRSSFVTLPRVLVLHLKRFSFTPSFELEKVHDPISLFRELVVSSSQGGGCYSLVSTINHIGATATSGHYICDGVDLDVPQEDPTDRWFTYNDAVVTETSSASVCDQRKRTSYILFYRRQD